MKKLSVVVCTLVWIIRGFFLINHGNIHIYALHIGVEMTDHLFTLLFSSVWMKKIECRNLYFLVSILRGIIFIVIVVITHMHIILASRWRFKMHIICFMNI